MNFTRWLVLLATLLFFGLALDSMVWDSPTMDEQNHLARGLAFIRTGDPRLSLEHPPLINAISALPLLTLPNIKLPTDHPSWSRPQGWYEFAELLLWEVNHDVTRMVFLARLPIVFLTLGLALTAYHFANELWRRPAGLVAYLLILFDPNILAHGRYTTTDLGGALFSLLAAFTVWRMWSSSGWNTRHLAAATIALGLAYSSKLSTLTFAPILGIMALLPLYGDSSSTPLRRLLQFGLANALALLVVWTVFAFQWGPLAFASEQLAPLAGVQAPMPTFWQGIEQIALLSGGGRPSFLLGETSVSGFSAYFPVAFLVKTPLPALLLLALVLIVHIVAPRRPGDRARAAYLLLPASLYFLVSMQSGLNIGYRHLLPILPFIYVAAGGAVGRLVQRGPVSASHATLNKAAPALAGLSLVAALMITTIATHPNYLSYFNLLGGGPRNGYNILVDSNVDWGQDLLRLKRWMDENEVSEINLSWFGSADPTYYGIAYNPLPGLPRHFDLWWNVPFDPQAPAPGIYAISVSNIWELPLQEEKWVFPWFREREPDDRVAYSILIYEVK